MIQGRTALVGLLLAAVFMLGVQSVLAPDLFREDEDEDTGEHSWTWAYVSAWLRMPEPYVCWLDTWSHDWDFQYFDPGDYRTDIDTYDSTTYGYTETDVDYKPPHQPWQDDSYAFAWLKRGLCPGR